MKRKKAWVHESLYSLAKKISESSNGDLSITKSTKAIAMTSPRILTMEIIGKKKKKLRVLSCSEFDL